MEDKLNQKPCVVQKIETPQGFSVSYKERLLYSKYNPSKNIISSVENLQISAGTVLLCFSPVLGYGLQELINKINENCLIILCEAEQPLYDFFMSEIKVPSSVLITKPSELSELPVKLYDLAKSGKYKRVLRLDMSGGVQFNTDLYNRLYAACTDSVMTFWKNRITLTRFGRRYSRNLFENLHYLADSKLISDYFNTIDIPIIVFGAGESTQSFIDVLLQRYASRNVEKTESLRDRKTSVIANAAKQSILSKYFILCVDTALQPLLKNGIKPDGVFVEEAQSVIVKAFTGTPQDIHIFAGLSSIPNLVHRAGSKNVSYFFTEYASGTFFDFLKAKDFMPPSNNPFGSVGLTAVYYALKFRKNNKVPVYVTGLDFSYSAGITHTKGALAHILRLTSTNRLLPVENYTAAFSYGSEKIKDKSGKDFYTTVTLKNYAAMFNSFFAGAENLFDIGECGIKLEIPHVDFYVANAPHNDKKVFQCEKKQHNPYEDKKFSHCEDKKFSHCEDKQLRHCEAEGRSNPHSKDIEKFLTTERKALEELRDLLTGHTELEGDELMQEIEEIAEPREYLYLHFPDGCSFSTNQSFLNRIRTEIDFFLKFI